MDAFTGEIRSFAFGYNPPEWIPCDGRQLLVQQYPALFSIINTLYGGTGNPYFNVPDLRNHAIIGAGQGTNLQYYPLADNVGDEGVSLTNSTLPSHDHIFNGYAGPATIPTTSVPADNLSNLSNFTFTKPDGTKGIIFGFVDPENNPVNLNPGSVSLFGGDSSGNSTPHENRSPFLSVYFCICIEGYYPVRP